MKLSISLSDEDVTLLDDYVKRTGLPSRSAGIQRAVRMLRYPSLEDDYAGAWAQWSADGADEAWDDAVGDGVTNAAR